MTTQNTFSVEEETTNTGNIVDELSSIECPRPCLLIERCFSSNPTIFKNGVWITKINPPNFKWSNCSYEKREEIFKFLKTCQCCERHQIDKPDILWMGWEETRWKNTSLGCEGHECECNCRHKMRMMARQYN